MTREEAKNILRNAAWLGTHDERNKTEEAVEMAISALSEQKKCVWCVHADLGDGVCKKCRNKSMWNVLWESRECQEKKQ